VALDKALPANVGKDEGCVDVHNLTGRDLGLETRLNRALENLAESFCAPSLASARQALAAADQSRRACASGVEETLTYYAFPEEHWRRIRTNNPLERLLREIRRRTRVVGAFPDGESARNLAAARLRHVAGTAWSTKRYLNIGLLTDQQMRGSITA
jgi:transposase-like protein